MRRADRLFEIVQILRRARRPMTAAQMAGELEVTPRTIYRDIAALAARRVPISGEAGIGYVLESGFDMPPLMLTPDELDAALLGSQWVASRGEPELARAAQNLMAKIEAVIAGPLRPHVALPPTSVAPVAAPGDRVSAADIRAAIRAGSKVRIVYRGGDGAESERTVWPVLLGYRDAGRILAAWCELRRDFRYFRVERMASAETLAERIPERASALRARWRAAMDEERQRYEAA